MASRRTIKSVRASCDRLWSLAVRARAGGVCERCGKPATQSHHTYGRSNYRLRFDLRNGVAFCFQCHIPWAESYSLEFTRWFDGDRTEDSAYLRREFQKGPLKRTLHDYLELEAELAEELAKCTDEMAA